MASSCPAECACLYGASDCRVAFAVQLGVCVQGFTCEGVMSMCEWKASVWLGRGAD